MSVNYHSLLSIVNFVPNIKLGRLMEIYTVTHDGNMVDEYADSNDFVKVNSVPGRTMRINLSIPG